MNLQYISNKHGERNARQYTSANQLRVVLPSANISVHQFNTADFTLHFGWITATENDTLLLSEPPCRFWYFGMLHNSMIIDIPGGGSCVIHETGVQCAFSPQSVIGLRVERAEEYGFFIIRSTKKIQLGLAVEPDPEPVHPKFLYTLPKVWKTKDSVDIFSMITSHLKQHSHFFPYSPNVVSSSATELVENISSFADQGKFLSMDLARTTYKQLRALMSLAHFCQPVDMLILEAGISDMFTFKKHIKKIYGCSVTDLIYNQKSRLAALLLRQNDLSIKEVAAKSGFANVHHFSRYFTQRFKTSPKKYREQFGI